MMVNFRRKKILIGLLLTLGVAVTVFKKYLTVHLKRHFHSNLDVNSLLKSRYETCYGLFTGYDHKFAVLKNVTIVPKLSEWCLPVTCEPKLSDYSFEFGKEGTHMNEWLTNVKQCDNVPWWSSNMVKDGGIAVAVKRYEYLNLYHTMTDWYNVFLTIRLLNYTASDVTVILLDQHPSGYFDTVWEKLFKRVIYWNSSRPLFFNTMVWNILGYESPLNYHSLTSIPFPENFSQYFLQRHGIFHSKHLNCKNISTLISFRRNYYFAPGTPIRILTRKIQNEMELVEYLKNNYKHLNISGFQLDQLPFLDQLKLIAKTDLLISMHGAGLSHILFLPKHAGVVELFPLYWLKYSTPHFKAFARWRRLKYSVYQNWNSANELKDYKTYIPPVSLAQNIEDITSQMCANVS